MMMLLINGIEEGKYKIVTSEGCEDVHFGFNFSLYPV